MTSVLRRAAAPFAVVTALVATLTACGSGPSQVNSAVILGDRVISVDEVQDVVNKVAKEPAARPLADQHKLDLVAREVVRQMILSELIDEAAREEGLRVDQDKLEQLREANPFGQELPTDGSAPTEQLVPELVYRARGFDSYANDQLLLDALAREHLGRDSVVYNMANVLTAAEARELAEKISADPDNSESLMRAASKPETGEPQLDRDTSSTPAAAADGLYLSAPANSVFVLPAGQGAQGGGGFQVVHLVSSDNSGSPDVEGSQVPDEQLPLIGQYALRPYAIDSDIRISPRYGVWNDAVLKVVPKSEAEVSGFLVLPMKNDRS